MQWFTAKLSAGPAFDNRIRVPAGLTAFIPFSLDLLYRPVLEPPPEKVALFWQSHGRPGRHPLVWRDEKGAPAAGFQVDTWLDAMQNETYRPEHRPPLSSRLGFNYHFFPGKLRFQVVKHLLKFRERKMVHNPVYPVDLLNAGCEIILYALDRAPASAEPLLVLSHDVETADDFAWVKKIADCEAEVGLRSSWNIIPRRYDIPHTFLSRLIDQGHEIGLHGIWHDCSEPFLDQARLRAELNKLASFINRYQITGHRAPSWYRTRRMFEVLSDYLVYDASCLDADMVCPAGYGGVGVFRPFRLASGLVELPCNLAFEAPIYWGLSAERLAEFWSPKIRFVRAVGGMLLINTHPDPNYGGNQRHLDTYRQLLADLHDQGWRNALPREVAEDLA